MARSNQLISAPNIYLFAFQQQQEFFSQSSLESLSPEWSTHKYCQILNHFHVCQKIKLNSSTDNGNLVNSRQNYPQDITQKQQFWGTIKTQENLELIQGEAYPSCSGTSHIISLRIHRQDKNAKEAISIDKLAFFNPQNCFSPCNIQTNLGQTIVITALVNNKENMQPDSLKSLADNCLSSFAHLPNSWQQTVSIDSSIIANGYFSTYYLPGNSRQYNQIIIGLFFRQKDRDNFHRHHQELSKFFLSLHKLTYVHQYSNNFFKLACYQIDRLKYRLKTLNGSDIDRLPSPKDVRVKYSSVSDYNRIDWQSHKRSFSQINREPIAIVN